MNPVWDDGGWAGLPALDGDAEADVCVVGLGGSGLAAVDEALRAGASVVALDGRQVAGGAAGANGGFLLAGAADAYHRTVARLGREAARDLYQRTLDELDHMAEATPDLVRRSGSLRLASSAEEEADCEEQLAALQADGFRAEPYQGPEGAGLLLPDDAATNPLARARLLASHALARGARLFEHSGAHRIWSDEVVTTGGVVRAGTVVVAVDGTLEHVLHELRGRVRTARLQMLATAPATEVTIPRPVYARWGYDYWQQLPDGRIAIGGCRDRFVDDEWTIDTRPTEPVQHALERILRDELGVTVPVTHRWAASAGFSHDLTPVLEEVRPRVFAVGGYSGTGNVLGAVCARDAMRAALS
jgi:gamma-glutamylputrescine oxidase